ncbi:hypothetical protein P8C59_001606 [Phyllachora maydis]|uniref:Origin recognition complex subunit 2 n=1 Tax=Phyllachora maydis TaxID=1825666 RepID=A0AAD9M9C3_9PEZI|nr:hypothetical protein P8C59_001606 [Phyllachora maydis]
MYTKCRTVQRRRLQKLPARTPNRARHHFTNRVTPQTTTPSAQRTKPLADDTPTGIPLPTPSRRTIADRSARRKSARILIQQVVGGDGSDDDLDGGEAAAGAAIARAIDESSASDDDSGDAEAAAEAAGTPSRRGRRPKVPGPAKEETDKKKGLGRGRRKKSPSPSPPPRGLPPHEQFFFQNKPGLARTSDNTLVGLELLTHDEYFSLLRRLEEQRPQDGHKAKKTQKTNRQERDVEPIAAPSWFPQWAFELTQGFNVCLYGPGSKKRLLHRFAQYLHGRASAPASHAQSKVVVVNGYIRTLTARDILTAVASALASLSPTPPPKLPLATPAAATQALLAVLSSLPAHPSPFPPLTLLVPSLDAPPLRKSPLQTLLATLAAHRAVGLVASVDTPSFPLLWDVATASRFRFVFHDAAAVGAGATTPFGAAEVAVVDEVHELLGRRGQRAGGREGVGFVLRSLPENARALFRLLVGEWLAVVEGEGGEEGGEGLEYRMVYNRAVEEFICSSEMAFRTLLKEFHDHQIIASHKDAIGTEFLSLPFRREELESILEDLTA